MLVHEFSILQQPLKTLGAKQSIYEADQLDDEALEMIMHPIRQTDAPTDVDQPADARHARQEKKLKKGTYFDDVYPNCLCFSDDGRLFVGDSRGSISACNVQLANQKVIVLNHFKITHKELEGD